MAARSQVIVGGLELGTVALLGKADLIWADPPWGPGLLKYFYTLNKNRAEKITWEEFLEVFCSGCLQLCPNGPIYVAMGNQWVDEMADMFSQFGVREAGRAIVYYPGRSQLPCTLWLGSTADIEMPPVPAEIAGSPQKKETLGRVVRWCLQQHSEAKIVADPCCGQGLVAKIALEQDRIFWGIELNPDRAAKTQRIIDRRKTQ